jgi:hypothetical protein
MPWLQLVRIECHDTEESFRDEVYIRVRSDLHSPDVPNFRVWGPFSMDEGDVEPLESDVRPISVSDNGFQILLSDEDDFDFDEHLGDWSTNSFQMPGYLDRGDIPLDLRFKGSYSSHYTLTIRITSGKPVWPP